MRNNPLMWIIHTVITIEIHCGHSVIAWDQRESLSIHLEPYTLMPKLMLFRRFRYLMAFIVKNATCYLYISSNAITLHDPCITFIDHCFPIFGNDWCFRPWFCTVRLSWIGDNLGEWDEFYVASCPNHRIDRPVVFSALPLHHGCLLPIFYFFY